jgi:hypothetical protein
MGKASSNKKVARAAKAGGGRISSGQPRSLLYPGSLALVVVLGIVLVVYARNDRQNDDMGGVPQLGDHIHEAIGFDICGEFQPNIPVFESNVGIHTHGDGVLHIHPFSQLGVGANATLGRYFKDARDEGNLKVSISDTKLTYLGQDYKEGKTPCKGVKDPILRLAYWPDVTTDSDVDPQVTTGDFADFRIDHDGGGITIFYGDRKADIPKPPNSAQLKELGLADQQQTPDSSGNTTTSTVPVATSSTVPGETTTTVAGQTTTTAAAGATTTTVAP